MSRSFASQGRALGVSSRAIRQTILTVVDSWEDSDIAEYGGDTGAYSTQTATVTDGSVALEGTASSGNYNTIASTTGLPAYPSQGDKFRCSVYLDTANGWSGDRMGILYGTQSETAPPKTYRADLDASSDQMIIAVRNSNGFSELATAAVDVSTLTDAWIDLEMDWTTTDDHNFTVYDSTGSSVNSATATDNSYTSGGVGTIVDEVGSNSTPSVYYDYYRIL